MRIPERGSSKDDVLAKLEEYRADDMNWREGKTWGYIFDPGAAAEEVGKQAYMKFLSENALDPTVFPSLLRFENDIVGMAVDHVHGDADTVGSFTSGGTESIILAVKTARNYCREHKPEIREPEMVLPITAHAAFYKAAAYLDVKAVPVDVDGQSFRADLDAVRDAIGPNTILLVGSAPSYAHGVIDPIEEMAKIALDKNLLFHVDACMGGFLLPYFRRLGEDVPPFDFQVEGVTSLSMDLHKYAYTPKGASLVLYRNKALRKHQLFACARWTGYTVVNPTLGSSKSGGPLAAAWAVLNFLGDEGYLEMAKGKLESMRTLVQGVRSIPELRVLGEPRMSLLSFASDSVNVFHVVDEMKQLGWYIQPQLGFGCSPHNIHLSLNASNVRWADALITDLRTCVERAKKLPSGELAKLVPGLLANVDPTKFTDEAFSQMLAMAGMKGIEVPDRTAEINEVLNALSPEFRELVLTHFFNDLFRPPAG
jgi:sphinganine-1-phosphate aldolase